MSVWVKVGDRQIPSLTRLTTNPLFNPSRSENDNYSMFGKDVRKHIPAFCLPEKKKKKKMKNNTEKLTQFTVFFTMS